MPKGPRDEKRSANVIGAATTAGRIVTGEDENSVVEELLAIGAHCAALRDIDTRSADEIIGYDQYGLPR